MKHSVTVYYTEGGPREYVGTYRMCRSIQRMAHTLRVGVSAIRRVPMEQAA